MSKLGDMAAATGAGAVDSAVGAVLGLALGGVNDKRQLKQQGKLNEQQIAGNKEMGKFNQEMQFDMWNKTNYGAQMKHIKDAGLNPALMYGMGGGGGTTTGSGSGTGGVSGADAPKGGGEALGMMQMGLMQAQKANIEASTENIKAETGNKGIVGQTGKFDLEMKQALKANNIDLSNLSVDSSGSEAKSKQIGYEQANAAWSALKQVISNPSSEDNDPLVKATRAELMKKVVEIDNINAEISNKRKEGQLKEDSHELNMMEMKLKDFKTDLTKIGLSGETAGLIGKILGLMFGGSRK